MPPKEEDKYKTPAVEVEGSAEKPEKKANGAAKTVYVDVYYVNTVNEFPRIRGLAVQHLPEESVVDCVERQVAADPIIGCRAGQVLVCRTVEVARRVPPKFLRGDPENIPLEWYDRKESELVAIVTAPPTPEVNTPTLKRLAAAHGKELVSKGQVDELEQYAKATNRRLAAWMESANFTTKNESDVGRAILAKDPLEVDTLLNGVEAVKINDVSSTLLAPHQEGQEEDQLFNGPMHTLLTSSGVLPAEVIAVLSVAHSSLVDSRGREQRADHTFLHNTGRMIWCAVITMMEGKKNLATSDFKIALGQAQRRAQAILEAQWWRDFVVVPVHCLQQISFLRLARHAEFREIVGAPSAVKETLPCIDMSATDSDRYPVSQGYRLLVTLLRNPRLLGYIPCPITVVAVDNGNFPFSLATVVSSRSDKKAVVMLERDQEESIVLKAQKDVDQLVAEQDALQKLSEVRGIPRLVVNTVVPVVVQMKDETGDAQQLLWNGLLTRPFAEPLIPIQATESLFRDYAEILYQAHLQDTLHHDISPDNLMVITDAEGTKRGHVVDWGCACVSEEKGSGFSGKRLFASTSHLEDPSGPYGLVDDLESLFYCLTVCHDGYVQWRPKGATLSDFLIKRDRVCGLRGKRRWPGDIPPANNALKNLMEKVATTLSDDPLDCASVLRAFGVYVSPTD